MSGLQQIYARYPFFDAAREAVQELEVDLGELVTGERSPVLDRARERVEDAISSGRVGDPVRDATVEVLSYPLARILVSLVDEPALTERYAEAEAERAFALLTNELRNETALRSRTDESLSLADILGEFDLDEAVSATESGYRVDVAPYLHLATALREGQWRLVQRSLHNGGIELTEPELVTLLREAVRRRVADGLPVDVPDAIAEALTTDVTAIRDQLADVTVPDDLDNVDPAAYPPCVEALIHRVETGADVPTHSQFILVSFLASIGMEGEEIAERFPDRLDRETVRKQYDRIHGDSRTTAYPPPSCATMQAYGDCVNMDELCERIDHPLEYYDRRLQGDAVTPR